MSSATETPQILVLDFGSQYTQLIARCVREAGVYCEIHPCDLPDSKITACAPQGIILSGGPESVTEAGVGIPKAVFQLDVPVLGICYGMQAMAKAFGGEVALSEHREFGYTRVQTTHSEAPLISGIADGYEGESAYLEVWMSHGDKISQLPEDFLCIASSDNAPIAAIMHKERPLYGLQFHPEVTHTPQGKALIERFVLTLCACEPSWTSEHIITSTIDAIREQVGSDRVVLGLSGGVDSSVAAALLQKAIGDQLICLFIDNGLLRKGESDAVLKAFAATNKQPLNIRLIQAEDRFLGALTGASDPEQKRKIIGRTFIEVFEQEANSIEGARWLGQGTIYSDVIESAASAFGKAHAIKSHHNVGGLPERMSLQLVEPLRALFKDEVRRIGLALGLPSNLINRHPFPGPGLAVRVLGEVRKEYLELLRAADAVFIEELQSADLYDSVSQAFSVFLPVQSVGVVGDTRRYEPVIALRAVETVDFMTAKWAELPYDFLGRVANRIVNELPGISRVVYDISSKPPATIEWE